MRTDQNVSREQATAPAWSWVLTTVSLFLWSGSANAVPPPTGIAPVLVPAGGFAIDGDLMANTPAAGVGDWLPGPAGTGGAVLDASGAPLNPSTTFHFIDPFNSSLDTSFVGGLKWNDDPNTWQWTTGKPSAKTDINNVLLHFASDANGHSWLIIAADRLSTSGDSYIDFEFLQNSLVRSNNGYFASSGPNGGRTVNDVLLSLAFTSGGSVADFFAWRWQPSGSGFAYLDATASLPAGGVFVAANSTNIAVPFGAFGQTSYSANAFAEAAIDLTALLGNFDPCLSIGVNTIMVKTKASQSSTATITDFIDPIQYTLKLGPSADAGPDQTRCTQGPVTDFPLAGVATQGAQPIASTSWQVVSGSATVDSPGSLNTTAHLTSTSATLRLTVLQANGCNETDDVVLTVAPVPACSIAGSTQVCPQSSTIFAGPAGMTAYAWSVSGGATISGATNSSHVTVAAGTACGTNFTVTLTTVSNLCSSTCTADVTVENPVPPVITPPADVVLECPANTATNATGAALARSDCGTVAISYSDAVTNNCGGAKVIARTWTATDLCGNASSAVQTITVRDTLPPTLTAPPNLTLECPADTSPSKTGVAVAQDGCSSATVSFNDSVASGCGGTKVITRLWIATDACGNSVSAPQTITVRDTTPPTITAPVSLVLECPANTGTNATGVAVAQDGCGAVTVRFSDLMTNNCGGAKVITRTWTATDECGNNASAVQMITVRDSTPPSLTCPPDLVLNCPADTRTNATGMATAEDGCGLVTLRYSDVISNNCGGTKVIARTWTATDSCGNSTNAVQTITVQDTTPPTLTVPPDLVLECPANTGTNATGVATAQDGCSTALLSFTDVISNTCGGTKVTARTWTASDGCGNSVSAVQTITVRDTTPPTLTVPHDLVLECPADIRTNATGVATAQDGCGLVTVSYSDVVSNGCGGTRVIARTWTAVDACGNSASAVQTLTIRDTTPPTIAAPQNLTLECPADTRTNVTGVATAQDGCGSVALSYSDVVSNGCGGTRVIARTWTAVDACGNSASAVQTITVRDTTPPTIIAPQNLVLECPADTRTNATGVATAQDGCSSVTVTYSDVVSNNCGGARLIARTWTATDACGNSASALQTITVRDTTPPTLVAPLSLVLDCPADTRTNATGVALAQDGCGAVVVSYSDSVSNECGGTKLIFRTWTATDACGNRTSALQTLTVRDTTPPSITAPPNVVLECPADTGPNATGVATAQDGCSSVTVTYSDVVSNNCGGARLIARTWTATDACGNTVSAVQKITVRDSTPPTITAPPNVVLECPANTSTNATGVAVAQDGCSSVTVTYSDVVSNNCGGARLIARTWTASDACGNSVSALQTITVRDTTPPTITAPPDLVLECPADTRTNSTGVAITQDGCSAVRLAYSDVVSNNCGGARLIARTWTATDACGNSASALQTILIRDTTAPSLILPPNVVLQCPGDTRTNITGVPTALDGCGSVTLNYSDVVSNGCGLTRTIQRLWTATDQCGNSTNGWQTIAVIDTNKPTVTCPNLAVQCPGDVPAAYADLTTFLAAGGRATDTCSPTLAFSLTSDSGLAGTCPGKVTRVYRVTDACGNFAECTQTITVQDTIAPVLACPTNVIVECGSLLDPTHTGRATATDNCSTNVSLAYTDAAVQSQYDIKFYVADSSTNTGPYAPTFLQFAPGSLPCPDTARLTGRALDPLRNAVAYAPSGQLDALTSIGNVPTALGQIVPFEVVIQASGGPGPERGTIEFTAAWSTYTTSNNRFGYDTNYMVYCAFVDAADPGLIDPNANARVDSYHAEVINRGTINEQIQGTFRVSGIESGDRVVVEIWMVLDSTIPDHTGGTVAATLVSAQTASVPPTPITVGVQTDSLGNLSKVTPLPPPLPQPPLRPLPPQPPVLPGLTLSVLNRTWTATDTCGNSSTCVQQITVRDTTPPRLSVPADLVLECPADTSTNATGAATATDACGSASITYSDSSSNSCGGTRVISRLWTAMDDSGNSTNAVQTLTIQDTAPPAITAPANLVLECPADTRTNATGVATARDGCSGATVTYSDVVSNLCGGTRVIARTWTAADACGNSASALQTIIVRDTTPPTILAPASLVLECPADTSTNATGVATAQDGCGAVLVSYSDAVSNSCGGTKLVRRTWTAVDTCGNTASALQTITVRDTTPPTVSCPLVDTRSAAEFGAGGDAGQILTAGYAASFPNGLAVGSLSVGNALFWESNATGLAALQGVLAQAGSPGGPLAGIATNSTTAMAGGELVRQAAALSLNIGFNAAGKLGIAPNNFGSLTYSNNLDSLSGLSVSQVLAAANQALAGAGLPAGYDFTSLAGLLNNLNLAFLDRAISSWAVGHLSAPMLVVQCGGQVPAPDPAQVIATDGCSTPVALLNLPDVVTDFTSSNHYTLTRTWVAQDVCGNTNTSSYFILVDDTTAPTLVVGTNRTVSADQTWSFDQPTALDNCGTVTITVVNTITNESLFGGNFSITRTWQAVDSAGNISTGRETITVTSGPALQPPVITTAPQSQGVPLGAKVTLSAVATGSSPLSYQWQFNGNNLAGATGSSLTLTGVQFTNAGLYTLRVVNGAGSATSPAALVDVTPNLGAVVAGNNLVLTWPSPFVLQSAPSALGPFTDVPGASSPYSQPMSTSPQRFFRLRASFSLGLSFLPNGQTLLSFNGAPGCNFILQASTDLRNWVSLETNTAPSLFLDVDAWQYPSRMYRLILAPVIEEPSLAVPTIATQPCSQTAGIGDSASLSVLVAGSGPLSYQWQFNGGVLAGATASSLQLAHLQFTNAGVYSVVVGNAAGQNVSSGAIVNVLPKLVAQPAGGNLSVSWPGAFVLQSATSLSGPFGDVGSGANPYTTAMARPQRFFRLRSRAFAVTTAALPGGMTSVEVSGSPGCNFIIQASTDLVNWSNLSTNTAPGTFVDSNAAQYPSRTYRVILAQ